MSHFKICMKALSDAFESRVTDHETTHGAFPRRWFLKEGSPEWMTSAIRDAHNALDGRFPDDWIYEAVSSLADAYTECDDASECHDQAHETCDGQVDAYTSALTAWLASHLGNVALCDEAAEETGDTNVPLDRRIAQGQYLALQRISSAVIDAVASEANDRETALGQAIDL